MHPPSMGLYQRAFCKSRLAGSGDLEGAGRPRRGGAGGGRHGAAPPLRPVAPSSRLREGSQVSAGASRRSKEDGVGALTGRGGHVPTGRRRGARWRAEVRWGRGAVAEEKGEGAEPPGAAGVRGPLRPQGSSFGPQTSAFSLLCRCPSLKRNSEFLCLFFLLLSGKSSNSGNL